MPPPQTWSWPPDGEPSIHNTWQYLDGKPAPDLVVRDGRVNAVYASREDPNLSIVTHDAETSGGNSGGPVVDWCGRVVAISTFVGADRTGKANFGLHALDLWEFLREARVELTLYDGDCR